MDPKKVFGKKSSYREDKFITNAISESDDDTQYKGREKTRLEKLGEALSSYVEISKFSGVISVLLTYAIYLSKSVDSPSTVKRYYGPIRTFVYKYFSLATCVDDIYQMDFQAHVQAYKDDLLASNIQENGPESTALNHFLKCFDIDAHLMKRLDPASAARKYAEIPSRLELQRAIEILPQISHLPANRTQQAVLALRVMMECSVRWFEVSRLRAIDVAPPSQATLVITHESVGTRKSDNADRVITGISASLMSELFELSITKKRQSSGNPLAYLFSDAQNFFSVSEVDEIHQAITYALYVATGSPSISPHSCRRFTPVSDLKFALAPENRCSFFPLQLRQFMFSMASTAGHGSPETTIVNYICDLDALRRTWADFISLEEHVLPSIIHRAAILEVPADTLRARSRRNSPSSARGMLIDLKDFSGSDFSKRVRQLSEFVVVNVTQLDIDQVPYENEKPEAGAIYTASLLLGNDGDFSQFTSGINQRLKSSIDKGMSAIRMDNTSSRSSSIRVTTHELLASKILVDGSRQLSFFKLSNASIITCISCINDPVDAWNIKSISDLERLKPILELLNQRVVQCIISRPKGVDGDFRIFSIFPKENYVHRALNKRNFSHGTKYRIQFIPPDSPMTAFPKAMPISTFLTNALLISQCASQLGGINE